MNRGGKCGRVLLVATFLLVMMGTVSAAETQLWPNTPPNQNNYLIGFDFTVEYESYITKFNDAAKGSGDFNLSIWKQSNGDLIATQSYTSQNADDNHTISKSIYKEPLKPGNEYTFEMDRPVGTSKTDMCNVASDCPFSDSNSNGITILFPNAGYTSKHLVVSDPDTYMLTLEKLNENPSIDSVSTKPSTWTVGNSVNVSADVSDSDGTVSSVKADVWKNGTQIVDGASLTENSGTWEIDNLFTVDESNVYYNYTLTATDNEGATKTYSDNQFVSDDEPIVNLNDPGNQSYFKYGVPLSVGVSDSDDNPGEDYSCTVDKDGSQVDSFNLKEGTNSSYSSTVGSDLGSHTVSVSCSDGSGNTGTASDTFTVKAFSVETVSAASPVYETENRTFQTDLKTGGMVNNVEFYLDYNGTIRDTKTFTSTGVETLRPDLYHAIPLVDSNQTTKNWEISFDVNKTDFQSQSTSILTNSTTTQNQEVYHSYNFSKHLLTDGFTQIEGSKLNYTAEVNKLSPNAQGSVTGETKFNQTGETKELGKNGFNYSNTFNTDLINSQSETFSLNSNFKISFGNSERNFSSSKNIQLDKIVIEDSSNGDNAKTLVYNSKDEVTTNDQKSDLNLGLQVWNPDQPGKVRSYNFNDNDTSTHEFYLNPGYATVKTQSFKSDSNQTDWNTDYKFLPDDYSKRKHYLINETLDNQTTNINLFMLEDTETQNIEVELLDTDLRPLERHVVRVERVFSGDGETRTVAMLRTGQQGKDSTFLDPNEQYIYTVFNPDGELVEQIGPQSISGLQTQLEITPEETVVYSNLVNDVQISDVQENNQSLVVEYVSETNRLNNMTLKVFNSQTFGTTLIDQDSNINPQGRVSVSGFNASNQSISYRLEATFGEDTVTIQTGSYGEVNQTYGDTGLFMGLIMFLALSITGLWRPSASIGLGIVGLFMMYFIGFVSISQTALISVVALGALIVWRMS